MTTTPSTSRSWAFPSPNLQFNYVNYLDTNKDPTMYKNKTQAIDEQQYHKQRIGVTKEIDKNTSETKKLQQAMAH
jgi:hypothetical protein